MSAGGLIVANLDCEQDWALARGHPAPSASPRALRRAGMLAAGLRLLMGSDLDRIWTKAPVETGAWPELEGLSSPPPVHGEPTVQDVPPRLLAWGETELVASLRTPARSSRSGDPAGAREAWAEGAAVRGAAEACAEADEPRDVKPARPSSLPAWIELLWTGERPDAATAARVNHRGFALSLAERQGIALPGETLVERLDELRRWLARGGAKASPSARWIARLPWAAAGRGRFVGSGDALDDAAVRRLEAMLALQGALHLAPLMDRVDDLAVVGIVTSTEPVIVGAQRQEIRGMGGFAGLRLRAGARWPGKGDGADPRSLGIGDENEARRLEAAVDLAARALRDEGYRGAFGIDAWRYRDSRGGIHLHALGEINARLTMGHLAWAAHDRLGEGLGWRAEDALRFAVGPTPAEAGPRARPEEVLLLARWQEKKQEHAMWMGPVAERT